MSVSLYNSIFVLVITLLSFQSLLAQNSCYHPESVVNPGGFPEDQVPQFIVIGSDDNTSAEGLNWILDFLASRKHKDGSSLRMSFYSNSRASVNWADSSGMEVVEAHKEAYQQGHELGNHTSNHAYFVFGEAGKDQIRISDDSISVIIRQFTEDLIQYVKVNPQHIKGFRTPYLAWSDSVFTVINQKGFLYDCSLTESRNGPGKYIWPYTMDDGAPGMKGSWWMTTHNVQVTSHPGLWQLPCYSFKATESVLLHMDSVAAHNHNGLITGLDYNMWANPMSGWKLNKAQSIEILKNTLDLNLAGNRAPMTIGMHSQYYANDYNAINFPNIMDAADRRAVIEQFIDYALTHDHVRFVTGEQVIHYMMNPVVIDKLRLK